jgi:dTDP-4-amino-4,6-dideoxygalactose transaminase
MEVRVNFSGRALDYTDEELAVVLEAARQAEPLTQGRLLAEFQKKFAAFQGLPENACFAVMNGVSALELSAQLCLFEEGDEVVIPSHTFTASAYPFLKKGAKPVWADIDPASRVVTAESIEATLTPKTRAVVVVHLYGYVADMPAIMKLAGSRGITVIEDAAQSIGAGTDGTRSGSFGDMAIFSFHSHKNLTTLGEGGMLVVRDEKLAALVPMLRHNGHCPYPGERRDYWLPAMGNVDLPVYNGKILWPNNYSIGEVECALGAAMLDRVDRINAEKRERALRFIDALAGYPELEFHRVDTTRHNYHLLVARMTNGKRDAFIRAMFSEHGVKCVVQYLPLNRYDFYVKLGFGRANCPHADAFYDNMVSFPFQHRLTENEFDHMLSATKKTLDALRRSGVSA